MINNKKKKEIFLIVKTLLFKKCFDLKIIKYKSTVNNGVNLIIKCENNIHAKFIYIFLNKKKINKHVNSDWYIANISNINVYIFSKNCKLYTFFKNIWY